MGHPHGRWKWSIQYVLESSLGKLLRVGSLNPPNSFWKVSRGFFFLFLCVFLSFWSFFSWLGTFYLTWKLSRRMKWKWLRKLGRPWGVCHGARRHKVLVKINVNGAVGRAGDRGAFSVICWDRNRTYLGSSLVTFNYITYVPTLEALACSEAHALASDIFVRNVLIFIW